MTTPGPKLILASPYKIVPIMTEFPNEFGTASSPGRVQGQDGVEYLIKGPSRTPLHHLVAANELVAVQIAERLSIPVQDHAVLGRKSDLYFGSVYMEEGTFDAMTKSLYMGCANRAIIYQIVAFDVWLINGDRHHSNLLARLIPGSGRPSQHKLLAIDHGHCLVWPEQEASDLERFISAPLDCSWRTKWVLIDYVRDDITDATRMREAITHIEDITDAELEGAVNNVPDGLINDSERALYADFLKERKHRLRSIFRQGGRILPRLTGV